MRVNTIHGYYITDESGLFHSFNNEPAIVINSYEEIEKVGEDEIIKQIEGYKAWYNHGLLHRENSPAIIRDSGIELYYLNGEIQDGSNNN